MKISDKVPPSLKQPLLFYQPLRFGGKNLNPPPFWWEKSESPSFLGKFRKLNFPVYKGGLYQLCSGNQ